MFYVHIVLISYMFGNLTHNQGVPGSCPGGPTINSSHLHVFVGGFFKTIRLTLDNN
jgi:hypothetical protein